MLADHTHAVDLLAAEHESGEGRGLEGGGGKHTLRPKMYLTCTCKHMESFQASSLTGTLASFRYFVFANARSSH